MRRWLIILGSLTLALACNFPGFPELNPDLAPTETSPTTDLPGEIEDTSEPQDNDQGTKPTPRPLETPTPAGLPDTPAPTTTQTPTATPDASPTPEPVVPGPPLSFKDPAWELVEWHQIPETDDWEGIISIHVTGGTAPYSSQLENQEIVEGLEVQARWRICKAMPATIRVWSADEQYVDTGIWVWELGCNDD